MLKALGKAPRRAFLKNLIRTAYPRRRTLLRYAFGITDPDRGEVFVADNDSVYWSAAFENGDLEWIRFHRETLEWPIPSALSTWSMFFSDYTPDHLDILTYLWECVIGVSILDIVRLCAETQKDANVLEHLVGVDRVFRLVDEELLVKTAFREDSLWLLELTQERTRDIAKWKEIACEFCPHRTNGTSYECIHWMCRHIEYIPLAASKRRPAREFGAIHNMVVELTHTRASRKPFIFEILTAFIPYYTDNELRFISGSVCEKARAITPQFYADYVATYIHDEGWCDCRRN